jgi:DNA-binding HxlR family transcriptional regulator
LIHYNGKKYVCFLDLGFEAIRGKWKSVLLCHLAEGPKRFLQLQKITCGVSHKMLNEQLSEMQNDGLIKKTIYEEAVPCVEYELTKKGRELLPALKIIESWAIHYSEDVNHKSNCAGLDLSQNSSIDSIDRDEQILTQSNCT